MINKIILLILILLISTFSFATDLKATSITDLGKWIDARDQGSYYANLPSMIRDDSGKIYVTYCSSPQPFNENYAPNWRQNRRYPTDKIRIQYSDNNSLAWSTAAVAIGSGVYDHFWDYFSDWKIERDWEEDGYYWEFSQDWNAWIGYQKSETTNFGTGWGVIMRTQENIWESACSNVITHYQNKYYIYFESITPPSAIISIHVARADNPNGPYEIWTVDGWKPNPTNSTWKPVISPNIISIAGDEYVADNYKGQSTGNPFNSIYGAGWPRGITQKNGKIYLYYIDTSYWYVWKDAQGDIHKFDRERGIPYQLVAIGEDPTNLENVYENRMVDSSGTELWDTFSPKYFPEQNKFYNFMLKEINGKNNIVYRSSENGIVWSDEMTLVNAPITEEIGIQNAGDDIIQVFNNLVPLSNKIGESDFEDLFFIYTKEHILPTAPIPWQDTPNFKWYYGGTDIYGMKVNLIQNNTQINIICSQYPNERYDQVQLNTHISEWRNGQHTLLEIIKRAKLKKYCN